MEEIMIPVGIIHAAVSVFLLMAAGQLLESPVRWLRVVMAGILGGLYSGLCLHPALCWLGAGLWRLAGLLAMGVTAFGISRSGIKSSLLFSFLQLTLTGLAAGLPNWSVVLLLPIAGAWFLLRSGKTASLEVEYRGKTVKLRALRDTGNTLKDPLTGCCAVVIDAQAAMELTGLTREQLRDPVAAVACSPVPGLRLIPYHTINDPGGMLLGLRPEKARIGSRRVNAVIGLAPENFGSEGNIQALIGGKL